MPARSEAPHPRSLGHKAPSPHLRHKEVLAILLCRFMLVRVSRHKSSRMPIVTSLLLALIAAIGAWIAYQQMLIASVKLNHDLFDRRFAIYRATQLYIIAMLKHEGAQQIDAETWWEVACAAPFLFDKQTANFIDQVGERGSSIRATDGTGKRLRDTAKGVESYNADYMWLINAQQNLEDTFQKSLNLFYVANPKRLIREPKPSVGAG